MTASAECPRCGEKDTWSCSRCNKTNIDNAIVKKNKRGETNCPYCEIPWGLNRKVYLQRVQDVIENTDYVVLVKEDQVKNGDIVVALLETGLATLKRFFRENGQVKLMPANSQMQPIYATNVQVQGKMVALIRKYL